MEIRVRVSRRRSLRDLANRLERAASTLQPRAAASVRRVGTADVVAAVRRAWMGVEVSSSRGGGEHSGLRARAAGATRGEPIATGVRVLVEAGAVDPIYGASLIRGLNGQGDWWHPVWGNDAVRARQTGQNVFEPTCRAAAPRFVAGLERVLDEMARQI